LKVVNIVRQQTGAQICPAYLRAANAVFLRQTSKRNNAPDRDFGAGAPVD
jgi:hypothetical protein